MIVDRELCGEGNRKFFTNLWMDLSYSDARNSSEVRQGTYVIKELLELGEIMIVSVVFQ